MPIKIILVDVNPKMVAAWRTTFEENPEVEVVQGSLLDQQVGAWVTPTNSRGHMGGGLDGIIKKHMGAWIEQRVQQEITRLYGGTLPLGHATCVPTGRDVPRYLISTPTMVPKVQDVSDTLNAALACGAAFQAVHLQNGREPSSIASVALPGLGTGNGKLPVEIAADLMWTAYNLFREAPPADFPALRAALEEQLGDLDPMGGATPARAKKKATSNNGPAASPAKDKDVDFDDW